MNTTARTPGDWKVISTSLDYFGVIAGPYDVASNVKYISDARLIAAAPDLLNALINALPMIGWEGAGDQEAVELARAAIAKATGDKP